MPELHRVLGEARSYFDKMEEMKEYYDDSDVFSYDLNKTSQTNDEMDDDEMTKKSSRACKGKRYMEFMNAQKMTLFGKRIQPRSMSTSSSSSLSPTQTLPMKKLQQINNSAQKLDYDTFDHLYANHTTSSPEQNNKNSDSIVPSMDNRDVNDFDLEHKINELPSHDLNEYLLRKQDTKKKKTIKDKKSFVRKTHKIGKPKTKSIIEQKPIVSPKIAEETKERLAMVGSQKRKARKESITRLDIQNITAVVQSYETPMLQNGIAPFAQPFIFNRFESNGMRCSSSGLLMLAEVASSI